jgi:hypothetical protein
MFQTDGPRLAMNWPRGKVLRYLRTGQGQKMQMTYFISERYEERFFGPIRCLIGSDTQGFGFAIMSLCCLLVETIQCYRLGWPASSPAELEKLAKLSDDVLLIVPLDYRLVGPFPRTKFSSQIAFNSFFDAPEHRPHFRALAGKGGEFYSSVRCGLLHQAQTKKGWRIRVSGNYYQEFSWGIGINRNEFAQSLYNCFRDFLKELENTEWNHPLWQSVWKKLWWLAVTS